MTESKLDTTAVTDRLLDIHDSLYAQDAGVSVPIFPYWSDKIEKAQNSLLDLIDGLKYGEFER